MRSARRLAAIALSVLVVTVAGLVAAGCGPISGITHIVRARIDVDLAQAAGADKHAPYELEAARLYLQKAKEEYGYSDFVAADDYAIQSAQFAQKARSMAEAAATVPAPAQ